jgi:hypothetical protein
VSDPEPQPVDLSKLQPGPIRNESLPPDVLEHVQAVYDVIGPYLNTTLEQFEIGFMRDANPRSEVALWCSITAAWIDYHEKYVEGVVLPDEVEKKLIGALVAISAGVSDVAKLPVPADVGRRLLECYGHLAEG